jgi:hypothetical protein
VRYTKKNPYTDLAVAAWHFYFGNPDYIEELMAQPSSWDGIVTARPGVAGDPTAAAAAYREKMAYKYRVKLNDWKAASAAAGKLAREADGDRKLMLLRTVFGVPQRQGVSSRVLCAAIDTGVSESTAWNWVQRANRFWAEARGVA